MYSRTYTLVIEQGVCPIALSRSTSAYFDEKNMHREFTRVLPRHDSNYELIEDKGHCCIVQ